MIALSSSIGSNRKESAESARAVGVSRLASFEDLIRIEERRRIHPIVPISRASVAMVEKRLQLYLGDVAASDEEDGGSAAMAKAA